MKDRTSIWLYDHMPSALRWWRLWLASKEALEVAREVSSAMTPEHAKQLLDEFADAERTAQLGYMTELIKANGLVTVAIDDIDIKLNTRDRLVERRSRIAELILDAQQGRSP